MPSITTNNERLEIPLPKQSTFKRAADGLLLLLGRSTVLLLRAAASTATFAYFLPKQIAKVTLDGTRGGAKILDEHFLTWTVQDADLLLSGLGATGRQAYRHFYLTFDFYFPALWSSLSPVSLLAILLRHRTRARYVAYLPLAPYLFDVAENLNHLTMLGVWPDHPAFSWTVGPWLTAGK
ncbi:hypothetical protein [Collimonas sp.]|jgi:hypothetical protein|uniref:hypothetical protein n=1 Tax=Collimonas sp. TaxID=1963772 RepID=UPI0037C03A9B